MRRAILYLDDDASHLELFHEMFGVEYDVRTTTLVVEARRLLVKYTPAIVISDQAMPEIMGTEFLREAMRCVPTVLR